MRYLIRTFEKGRCVKAIISNQYSSHTDVFSNYIYNEKTQTLKISYIYNGSRDN